MSDDLIIIVPLGTRVRYCESEHVDKVFIVDAEALRPNGEILYGHRSGFAGLPVYDAERYEG